MAKPGRGSDYPVEKFEANGFAFRPILSTEEAKRTIDQIEDNSNDSNCQHPSGNDRFKIHLFLDQVNRIVHHPTLLQAVRQALQTPHIVLWSSDLNIKQPNSKQFYSAHQDATYTGLQPADQCLTVWVALSDPVGIQEGCLSFLKGSHKRGQLSHVEELDTSETKKNDTTNMLSRGQRVVYDEANSFNKGEEWVSILLRAGEATFHHFHTIHQSGHNLHPTQPRVGLALRYMSQLVRQTGPVRECITWIDTENDHSNNDKRRRKLEKFFDLEPQLPSNPTEEDLAKGHQAHEEAMRRENSNYFLDSTNVKAYEN